MHDPEEEEEEEEDEEEDDHTEREEEHVERVESACQYWCPQGHILAIKTRKGGCCTRAKKCSACQKTIAKGEQRCSCKMCHYHLCLVCHDMKSNGHKERLRSHDREVDLKTADLNRLKEELHGANVDRDRFNAEQDELRKFLPHLEEEVVDAESEYEKLQRDTEMRAEDRSNRMEEEMEQLEAELESLAREEQLFLERQESVADNGEPAMVPSEVLARECQNLRSEQKSFEKEAADWRKKFETLRPVHPRLHSEFDEIRKKNALAEKKVASLKAELIRLEDEEDGDLVQFLPRSPRGKSRLSPQASPRKQPGSVSEQEVWRIEAAARTSKQRVLELTRELEEALDQSSKRQQKFAGAAELRARRLLAKNTLSADLAAELGRDNVEPGIETTALASGIRAQQAIDPNISMSESWGESLRRRIEETPRPRPPPTHTTPRSPSSSSALCFECPEVQASNLVEDNAKLRAEVQALHVSLIINGSQQKETEDSELGHRSPLFAEPQLETTLSHSRTRLRTMLREQLEDSRKLMASLHNDIATSSKSLQRERKLRDELEQRLRQAEAGVTKNHEVTPTKFRSAAAAPSPEPLPPNLSMLTSQSELRHIEEVGAVNNTIDDISGVDPSTPHSSATDSPLSYGGGWVL